MKKVVKFSGIIALGLSLLGFILMMATPCITVSTKLGTSDSLGGIKGIFGDNAQWCGTLAWIFALVSIIVLALTLLPLCKVNVLEKFNRLFAIIAAVLLVVGGIVLFFEASAFTAGGGEIGNAVIGSGLATVKLGAGWVVSGILLILGGLFSLLPIFFKAE